MSAGTQGFTDTRQDTNHIGSVISRILEARQLAEDERKYAEAQADKYQTSLEEAGVKRGDFFKKALRWKFGGEFKQKKLSQLNTWKKRGDLLKSAATGKSGRNKLNKIERSQALFDMFKASDKPKTFRDKFKPLYEGFVDDPMVRPMSQLVKPGTAKKIQKATTSKSKKRVSKEDILDSISSITDAIEKIAESISEKNRIVSDQMIHSSVLQGMIHAQLKSNGDSLEDKLQKIVDAISNQTQYQTKAVSKAKSRDAENKLEAQKDAAGVASFDDLTTKEDESKVPERPMGGYPELSQMGHAGMDVSHLVPKAEQGAILSGPDSGYLAELHGNEMVVPLDNNYTQGEPSAVDGKVRPKPIEPIAKPKSMPSNNIQKFEMGTNKSPISSSPITSKFGFNTARNQMGIAGGGTTQQSKMTQSMVDVMSLPMMAAGGTILAATTKYMQSLGGEGANISPEIQRVSRPIAETFGLPPSIVNKAKQGSTSKPSGVGKPDEEGEEPSKNIFAKLMDGFGAMLDKMKDSINTTPPPPPPDPTGTAQPADISGNEKELLKRLMIAESGGEGTEGMAMVGRSVLNRAGLVQSGKLGAGQFNAESGSVTDIIQASNQYQPYAQGKLNRALSAEENARAEAAYQLMMNDPEFRKAIKSKFKLSESDVGKAAAATGFRNYDAGAGVDTSQQVNEFVAGRHTFNTAGNAGLITPYSSATVDQPTPTPTPTPSPVQLGQAITNNYGLKVGQERTFDHPEYGEIKAHKTAVGFDFYDGPAKLDMSKPQGKSIVEYFTSTNGGDPDVIRQTNINEFHEDLKRVTERANRISSLSPGNKSESGNIAMLNIGGGGSQTPTAGSSPQPTGEDGTESGRNPTQNFYSNSFSIGVG
jgi:hypothetical protein